MARASRTLTAIDPTERALAWLAPSTFFLAVLSGIRTVSSWSWPNVVCPLRSRVPMTVKGTFLIRITWPSGSLSPNRLPATVRSEEHTSELQSRLHLVCRLLLEKKKKKTIIHLSFQKKKKQNT